MRMSAPGDASAPGNAELQLGKSAAAATPPAEASISPSLATNAEPTLGVPRTLLGWYSRGYLPHRDQIGLLQFVTFRLADSLPQERLRHLEEEITRLPTDTRDFERRKRIEQWLDSGLGCCALQHPQVAKIVEQALLHFDGARYRLLAWCIMPNHVHALLQPEHPLARIVQSWKSTPGAGHWPTLPSWSSASQESVLDARVLGSIHPRRKPPAPHHRLHPRESGESRSLPSARRLALVERTLGPGHTELQLAA
jgi:type I restriction enzyme R subunit/putative DNA methylase